MGEKGQPATPQSPASTVGVAASTVSVRMQQGAVQHDSDWAGQDPASQGGEKGQAGTGTLANMNLQKELQKESKNQEDLSNVSKRSSDAAESTITKDGG